MQNKSLSFYDAVIKTYFHEVKKRIIVGPFFVDFVTFYFIGINYFFVDFVTFYFIGINYFYLLNINYVR